MEYDYRAWQAQIDGLLTKDWDVFATLKFADGFQLKPKAAHQILRTTWNMMDRTFFGRLGVERGVRIQRYGVLHMGKSGKNMHFHCVAQSVGGCTQFCDLLRATWCNGFAETGELEHCKVTQVLDRAAVSTYMYHELPKLGTRTFVDTIMHNKLQATDLGTFRGIGQMRRVLRHMEKIGLGD